MKLFKIFAAIVAALLFLIVAASFILPSIIDVNQYRSIIEEKASDATGRVVKVDGEISLSILPKLHIKTGKVFIGQPDSFSTSHDDAFFTLDSANIGIEVLPLLQKNIAIKTIEINGATANLHVNKHQENNWTLGPVKNTASDQPTESSESNNSFKAFENLKVKQVAIKNAKINYIDDSKNTKQEINDLNISIKNFALNSDSSIDTSLTFFDVNTQQSYLITSQSVLNINLAQSIARLHNIDLNINQQDGLSIDTNIKRIDANLSTNQISIDNIQTNYAGSNNNADITIDDINITDNNLVEVGSLSANAVSGNHKISLTTPTIGFELASQTLLLGDVLTMAHLPENNHVSVTVPPQTVELANNQIAINDITGKVLHSDIPNDNKITLQSLQYNKDEQSFNVSDFIFSAGELITTKASVNGTLSPLAVTFQSEVNSNKLSTLLDVFDQPSFQLSDDSLQITLRADYTDSEQQVNINELSGNISGTTLNATANMQLAHDDIARKYNANINLGKINLDDWLIQQSPAEEANQPLSNEKHIEESATENLSLASAELKSIVENANINTRLSVDEILSKRHDIKLQKINLSASSQANSNKIATKLDTKIKHSTTPLSNLSYQTKLQFNNDNIQLKETDLSFDNKDQAISLAIPSINIGNNSANIVVNNIETNLTQENNAINAMLNSFEFNQTTQMLMIKSLKADGHVADNKIIANLPFTQFDLNTNELMVTDLSLDLNASEPVGRVNIPSLNFNLETSTLSKTSINFEGVDGKLTLNLEPSTKNDISGRLTTSRLNLKGLLNRFHAYPFDANSSALTNINIDNNLRIKDNILSIDQLNATIDKSSISGNIKASIDDSKSYTANLTIDKIDIRDYMASKEERSTDKKTNNKKSTTIPYDAIKGLNVNSQINITQLISFTGSEFSNVKASINASKGRLAVSPLTTNYAGGNIAVNTAINSNSESLALDAKLSKLNVGSALSSLDVTDKFTGIGDFAIDVIGSGKTTDALLKGINGKMNINIKDGDFKGIDIQEILLNGFKAFNALKKRDTDIKYEPKKNTKFGSLNGSWNIKNGVMSGNDLALTAPAFDVRGKGSVHLAKQAIDYVLDIGVIKSFEGQGRIPDGIDGQVIPLKITGNLSDPSFRLDLSKLLQNELNNRLKEQKDKLQDKLLNSLGKSLNLPNNSQNNNNQNNSNSNNQSSENQSFEEQLKQRATEEIGKQLFNIFN